MNSHSYKIIFNPTTRGGKFRKKIILIEEKLKDYGIDYKLVQTEDRLHAIELAESAKEEGYSIAVAAGGDGTVHEVSNGCIRANIPLGIINIGSGNDFASGIGLKSWEHAVDTLIDGKIQKISVVDAGDRYSVNVLDAGVGADVVKMSETQLKWLPGQSKYTLLAIKGIIKHKPYRTRITVDGKENVYDLNILAIGFGQSFGSGMRILPKARYNQKKMNVAIIHSGNSFKILRLFPKLFSGKHIEVTEHVEYLSGNNVKVELLDSRHMPVEAEGEIFKYLNSNSIEMRSVPSALSVITPKEWDFSNTSLKVKKKDL